jgi:hypothetical protein
VFRHSAATTPLRVPRPPAPPSTDATRRLLSGKEKQLLVKDHSQGPKLAVMQELAR